MVDFGSIDSFRNLSQAQKDKLAKIVVEQRVIGGQTLMREGESPDAMYFVMSGRFAVEIEARSARLSEIGPGQTVGEIGFLSGEARTATVTAMRDSLVLKLSRSDYQALCRDVPDIMISVSASLAKKLAETTRSFKEESFVSPRTIALVPAGGTENTHAFSRLFTVQLGHFGSVCVLNENSFAEAFPGRHSSDSDVVQWLNKLENDFDFILYELSRTESEWSSTAIRQSDAALLIADEDAINRDDCKPNAAESLALKSLHDAECRLVCMQTNASVNGTDRWLFNRSVASHHHVFNRDPHDVARVARYLTGNAVGLLASGGGAYCAAHVGFFRALTEAGIRADIFGGASGGAATISAMTVDHVSFEQMSEIIDQMFVKSGSLKKLTLPIFSVLDQQAFDESLKWLAENKRIEDLNRPFFAVSTNLSTGSEVVHTRGPLWRALRASASIPALLPPYTTESGDVLVDGGIIDNVPLRAMQSLKSGPNIILAFEPKRQIVSTTRYEDIPGRIGLLKQLILPQSKNNLPDLPKIGATLMQCLLLNNSSLDLASNDDLVAQTPLPKDIRLNDWHRHRELTQLGYEYGLRWLDHHRDSAALQSIFRVLETNG
ncbi:MAG: patatin-like phospholipase family protein [Pseudomonadota bacterium]